MRQLRISKQITSRESQSLEKYLQEISKVDLISADEEIVLAKKIKAGDQIALEKLTKANLRFVVSVAKQYQHQGLPLDDLINEGNLGLIKAAKKFDETRGFKFISYAVWWIRQTILQALADQVRLVRLPLNRVALLSKISKANSQFEQLNRRTPTAQEIGDALGISASEVTDSILNSNRCVSVNSPVNGRDDANNLLDIIANKGTKEPDASLMSSSMREDVGNMLSTLSIREADVIKAYFGFDGHLSLTLEEIGEKFGLTRERVRQIKERALRRLRQATFKEELRAYL